MSQQAQKGGKFRPVAARRHEGTFSRSRITVSDGWRSRCEQNSPSNLKSDPRTTAVLQQRAARNASAVVVHACAVCVSPVLLSLRGIADSIGGLRCETPAAPHPSLSLSLLSGALPHNTNTTRLNASSDVFTSSYDPTNRRNSSLPAAAAATAALVCLWRVRGWGVLVLHPLSG